MNLQVIDKNGRTRLNKEVSYFSLEPFVIKYGLVKHEFTSDYLMKKPVRVIEIDSTDIVLKNGTDFMKNRRDSMKKANENNKKRKHHKAVELANSKRKVGKDLHFVVK